MTLSVGDHVTIDDGTTCIPGQVLAILPWRGILVTTDQGLYLDVVLNISAASWTRLIRLTPEISDLTEPELDDLLTRISYSPKRTDLEDIPEALGFCGPSMKLRAT